MSTLMFFGMLACMFV